MTAGGKRERRSRTGRLRLIAYGLLVLLLALLLWGFGVEPRLIAERHETASIPNLGATWAGREVAVIGDLQIGMWGANTGTVRRIVRRLVERPPAIMLVAGDIVYRSEHDLEEKLSAAVALLRPLTDAGIPTFAVLGNHDYGMHWAEDPPRRQVADAVERALEDIGVHVLRNEAFRLTPPAGESGGEPLWVVGVDDLWAGEARPLAAILEVPEDAPRIVFMHHAGSFPELPPGTAPLTVAAHTHGGQISLPFFRHWSWMELTKHDPIEPDGWAPAEEEPWGNRLYVNVGIGFSDIPVRINATPELTRFELHGIER